MAKTRPYALSDAPRLAAPAATDGDDADDPFVIVHAVVEEEWRHGHAAHGFAGLAPALVYLVAMRELIQAVDGGDEPDGRRRTHSPASPSRCTGGFLRCRRRPVEK